MNRSKEQKSLYDLLSDADLLAYYSLFVSKLGVTSTEHLKYVNKTDLSKIDMTNPEQERLLHHVRKIYPETVLGKLKKKVLFRKTSDHRQVSDSVASSTESFNVPFVDSQQHIIPSAAISLLRELGVGEFGKVYQGVWTAAGGEKVQVAVKCVAAGKIGLDFIQEVSIMHKLNHRNIVRLYGVVLEPKSVMLISELAPLRSLLECLRESSLRPSLPVLTLCEFVQQICSGMAYLEAKRFIHRDLAARNILVFGANVVKISDFGLSRALGVGEEYYRTNFSVNLKLPIAWCAPECMHFLRFTHASDVWAFGVTLWEIFTYGFQPWAGMNGQQILQAIDLPNCLRLECPDTGPQQYYGLMLQCWEHDPLVRPHFSDILTVLPEIKPERVQAVCDCSDGQVDHLYYKSGDIITVLDTSPKEYPDGYYWRGVMSNGRTGLFLPTNTVAYVGVDLFSSVSNNSVAASARGSMSNISMASSTCSSSFGLSSLRNSFNKGKHSAPAAPKLDRSMISLPQGDFRHTGHVGSDGSTFGDVKFASVNRDHLPKQVVTPFNNTAANIATNSSSTMSTTATGDASGGMPPPFPITAADVNKKSLPPSSFNNGVRQRRIISTTSETACLINNENDDTQSVISSIPDLDVPEFANQSCVDLGGSLLDEVFAMLDSATADLRNTSNATVAPPSNENASYDVAAAQGASRTNFFFGSSFTAAANSAYNATLCSEPSTPSTNPFDATDTDQLIQNHHTATITRSLSPCDVIGQQQQNKTKKRATVKPMSNADSRIIDEVTTMARRMAGQALLNEQSLKSKVQSSNSDGNSSPNNTLLYNATVTSGDNGSITLYHTTGAAATMVASVRENKDKEKSPSPSLAQRLTKSLKLPVSRSGSNDSQGQGKSFAETIAQAQQSSELDSILNSDEAQSVYSALVEKRAQKSASPSPSRSIATVASASATIGRTSNAPTHQKASDISAEDQSDDADDNPLRRLRDNGGGIARSFRAGSGRGSKPTHPQFSSSTASGRQNVGTHSAITYTLTDNLVFNSDDSSSKSAATVPHAPPPKPSLANYVQILADETRALSRCSAEKRPPPVPPKPIRPTQSVNSSPVTVCKSISHSERASATSEPSKHEFAGSFGSLILQLDDIISL